MQTTALPSAVTSQSTTKPQPTRQEHTGTTRLRIELPDVVAADYDSQAAQLGRPVEDVMAQRLRDCRHYRAERPLYFNDQQRKRLEQLAGSQLRDPDDALTKMTVGLQTLIGDTVVELDAETTRRIPALLHSPRRTIEQFLRDAVRRAVGLIQ